jgi:beta-N-acetylhexosaminidase
MVVGIEGTALDPERPTFGGYLLFARNGTSPEAVRPITDATRALDEPPPPLVAIDQEGGAVARLREGVEPIPSMMALGAADDLDLARRAGEQIAFDLRRAGCTIDFAPVLDLALDPRNTVIGTRSFGSDPQRVAALGDAVARGLQQGGIIPCFKHFPGHGATDVDSHTSLPVIDADESMLRARDLIPFAKLAPNAPAFMSAHVVAKAFDAKNPATLSHRVATDVLRNDLGFRGALLTDCLEMDAVSGRGAAQNAVDALIAGADGLLFSHRLEDALAAAEAIESAVSSRRVARERLEEAHARMQTLRNFAVAPLPLHEFPPHPGVGREIARASITLLRGVPHADPVADIAISFGGERLLEPEAPALEEICVPLDPPNELVNAALETLAQSQRRPILLARRARLYPAQAHAVNRIVELYPDALVVSLLETFDLPLFENARHLLAAYGDDEASIGGLADVLFSGTMPTGHVPVEFSS